MCSLQGMCQGHVMGPARLCFSTLPPGGGVGLVRMVGKAGLGDRGCLGKGLGLAEGLADCVRGARKQSGVPDLRQVPQSL